MLKLAAGCFSALISVRSDAGERNQTDYMMFVICMVTTY